MADDDDKVTCWFCDGRGWTWSDRLNQRITCGTCGGTGKT